MSGRTMAWPGFVNARTLGGIPVADGVIREGALYRSERPGQYAPTRGSLDALSAAGVAVVVDLRDGPEGDEEQLLRDLPGRASLRIVDPSGGQVLTAATTQGGAYLDILDQAGESFVAVLRHLVTAPPGAVLVHCTAGKDRTGLVVALLLSLLGADEADVVDDYAATKPNLAPFHEGWLASLEPGPFRDRMRGSDSNAPRDAMETVLAWLRDRGGAEAWLRSRGLSEADVAGLRARFVVPRPSAASG